MSEAAMVLEPKAGYRTCDVVDARDARMHELVSIPVTCELVLDHTGGHPLQGVAMRGFGKAGGNFGSTAAAVCNLALYLTAAGPARICWAARVRFPDGEAGGILRLGPCTAPGVAPAQLGFAAGVNMQDLELDPHDHSAVVTGSAEVSRASFDQVVGVSLGIITGAPGALLWAAVSQA